MFIFFFQAEDGIRDWSVTGVQTCALPISADAYARLVEERRIDGVLIQSARLGSAHLEGFASGLVPCVFMDRQIGRASCRERVEISVVDVSCKEKKLR